MKNALAWLATTVWLCLSQAVVAAAPAGSESTAALWSSILGERREVQISLPSSYGQTQLSYPLLFVLDGETHFAHATGMVRFLSDEGLIPEMIVVGVPNTDRKRDMSPTAAQPQRIPPWHAGMNVAKESYELWYHSGRADAFIGFLQSELTPWLAQHYRTQPFRVVMGHSRAGMFAIHTLLGHPEVFQGYLAISPALQWNGGEVVRRAMTTIPKLPGWHFLRVSWADQEQVISQRCEELVEYLQKVQPSTLEWESKYYAGYNHMTSPHLALYEGLLALFRDWMPKEIPTGADTPRLIREYYEERSRKLGFAVTVPPALLDEAGWGLWGKGLNEAALAVYSWNLQSYPRRAQTYERMGKVYEGMERWEEAASAYESAVRFAAEAPDVNPLAQAERVKTLEALRRKARQ